MWPFLAVLIIFHLLMIIFEKNQLSWPENANHYVSN